VKLLDANVLLYANNRRADHHESARHWLLAMLAGTESIMVPWICSVAYLRISTHPRTLSNPVSVTAAMKFLRSVMANTRVIAGEPDHLHLDRVEALLASTGRGGNLVNDAHVAALALQYEATVVSYDNDFSRFAGVRWERPTPPQ
jgi:toxin-antitoxin system PIN domain toxin